MNFRVVFLEFIIINLNSFITGISSKITPVLCDTSHYARERAKGDVSVWKE